MMLVLASASPRRRAMLTPLGYPMRVAPAEIDETPWPHEAPVDFALRMAVEKAMAVPVQAGETVLAADTVVHLAGTIFGKPRDNEDAERMLSVLSDREHEVTTAFCLLHSGLRRARAVSTRVRFRALSAGEVAGYVATGEPLDKAGAYGIQGVGGMLVLSIQGSYSNVVGLPLAELFEELAALGWPPPFSPGILYEP